MLCLLPCYMLSSTSCVPLCAPWPRERLSGVVCLQGRDSQIHGLLDFPKETVKMQIPGLFPTPRARQEIWRGVGALVILLQAALGREVFEMMRTPHTIQESCQVSRTVVHTPWKSIGFDRSALAVMEIIRLGSFVSKAWNLRSNKLLLRITDFMIISQWRKQIPETMWGK